MYTMRFIGVAACRIEAHIVNASVAPHTAGIEPDADGAFMMLSKALKKVFNVSSLSQIQVESKATPEAPASQQDAAGASAASASASMARLVERMNLTYTPPGQAAALLQLVARAAVVSRCVAGTTPERDEALMVLS